MAQEEDNNEQFTTEQFVAHQPRCEIAKTLIAEGECQRLGEVQIDGKLLCAAHAEMVKLGERSEAMLSNVFKMDEWLESVDGQADELRVRRAEHHRNELVEQLRFNRTRMELIRNELRRTRIEQYRGRPSVRVYLPQPVKA